MSNVKQLLNMNEFQDQDVLICRKEHVFVPRYEFNYAYRKNQEPIIEFVSSIPITTNFKIYPKEYVLICNRYKFNNNLNLIYSVITYHDRFHNEFTWLVKNEELNEYVRKVILDVLYVDEFKAILKEEDDQKKKELKAKKKDSKPSILSDLKPTRKIKKI